MKIYPKLFLAALFGMTALQASAQRVVTIIELDDKPLANHQLQDPRTLVGSAIASETFAADGLFRFNKSEIHNLHYRQADFSKLANLAIRGNYYVRVDAFADELGGEKYNQSLSEKRAKAVSKMLSSHYGVSSDKIIYTGWGENYPVVYCDTSKESLRFDRDDVIDCLSANRRVMVSVIKGN